MKSGPIKCDVCDSYTHKKNACLRDTRGKTQFYCNMCTPSDTNQDKDMETSTRIACKVAGGFKCQKCGLISKSYYNLKRHIGRMHLEEETEAPIEQVNEVAREPDNVDGINESDDPSHTESDNIDRFLKNIGLEQYTNVFSDNDMDVLLDLRPEEFTDMVKDFGINPLCPQT